MTSTNDYDFKKFNYYIVGTFAEVLNEIEQHSYEKLTDDWWKACHAEVKTLIQPPDVETEDIQQKILDKVLAEFPKDMMTAEQITMLKKILDSSYKAYYNTIHPVHYCGDWKCDWDCGVQSCGGCIDTCRCDAYYDSWY